MIICTLSPTADTDTAAHALYQACITADCADLAAETCATMHAAKSLADGVERIIRYFDAIRFEWQEAQHG